MDKRFIQKVRRTDRIATRVITVGGLLIIACVIAILLLIARVTLPLFSGATTELRFNLPLAQPAEQALAIGIDDYQETAYRLDQQGVFAFYHLQDGRQLLTTDVKPNDQSGPIKSLESTGHAGATILWADNSVSLVKTVYQPEYDANGQRSISPAVETVATWRPGIWEAPPKKVAARQSGDGRLTLVGLLDRNRFQVFTQLTETDIFDNETTTTFASEIDEEIPGNITVFTLDEPGKTLYAGTDSGSLLRWNLLDGHSPQRTDNVVATDNNQAITALSLVFGDVSVAVGDAAGGLATWMAVRTDSAAASKRLRQIHRLAPHAEAVREIIASRRSKSLWSLDAAGVVHCDHMTSENHLVQVEHNLTRMGVAGRDNSLIGLDPGNNLLVWQVNNPHPEVSFKTLFGKVWYENYDRPEFVWQSSSGNDDFEPKLSIVPLLFGTLKGTLYAMLFAIPLAIFGAVYTSQCTPGPFRRTIKPAIEIMASVPSVVIGFLIALWLAPIVEQALMPVLLGFFLLPLIFLLIMLIYQPLVKLPGIRNLTRGYEFLLLIPLVILTGVVAIKLGPVVETRFFGGDFQRWLYTDLNMRYDQRNSIIIAFGLGIAVIPIIFSITEDAISNIPPSLTAASLALGASRWQTIWRVVLPSASPGIFAAVMIGFGRAVGETMIVLMATGNTPIMDWSIFNGMRTLSANIAVEIPEAPVGGTLYRVLFLCATLLFGLTFILNTGAEIVRERLRKKYGRY